MNIITPRTLLILQIIATIGGIIWVGIQLYDYVMKKKEV